MWDNGCAFLADLSTSDSGVVKNLGFDEMTNVSKVIASKEDCDCEGCNTTLGFFEIILCKCNYTIVLDGKTISGKVTGCELLSK